MIQIKVNYQDEILLALLKREMHGRGLAKELKTSLTRVQSVLRGLRNINAIDYRTEGRNHIYFIRKNLVARSCVLAAEHYNLAKLLRRYPLLEPSLREIIKRYPDKMIILFGSYAKFIPKEDSDIDIYVETSEKKIKESISRMDDRLSVKIGTFDPDDLLINEIIKNHIIIQGGERFYERLGFFGQTQGGREA